MNVGENFSQCVEKKRSNISLVDELLLAFCILKTTKIIIIVIGPYLGPKRNPMVPTNVAEISLIQLYLASSFIKSFTLLFFVIVPRVILLSFMCNTEISTDKTAWKCNYYRLVRLKHFKLLAFCKSFLQVCWIRKTFLSQPVDSHPSIFIWFRGWSKTVSVLHCFRSRLRIKTVSTLFGVSFWVACRTASHCSIFCVIK